MIDDEELKEMNAQRITTPAGERLVMLPEADYEALISAVEDAMDVEAIKRFEARLAAGEEELIPAEIVKRLLSGENLIRVWREYRGLSASELAEKASIAPAYLSQMETGKRDGTVETLKKIAKALEITLDDLVS